MSYSVYVLNFSSRICGSEDVSILIQTKFECSVIHVNNIIFLFSKPIDKEDELFSVVHVTNGNPASALSL